jgi:hypothetical protein
VTVIDSSSLFRVVPGNVYLDDFASDRSHMVSKRWLRTTAAEGRDADSPTWKLSVHQPEVAAPVYRSPPPPYPQLSGKRCTERGVSNNLMASFVCMSPLEDVYGDVLDINQFSFHFGGT